MLLSRSWFVAPGGSDNNPGTLAQPLHSIQQAASLAATGDSVLIRGGVYRETVHPAHSGITFQNYNNESVTVSGADAVGGWGGYSGSIYRSTMPWDLGDGNNQVFVDGRMINEARWPNTSLDLSHPTLANAQSISTGGNQATIRDSRLSGGWTGTTIHFNGGEGWYSQTGTVISSSPGSLTFRFTPDNGYTTPRLAMDSIYTENFRASMAPASGSATAAGSSTSGRRAAILPPPMSSK